MSAHRVEYQCTVGLHIDIRQKSNGNSISCGTTILGTIIVDLFNSGTWDKKGLS